LSTQVGLNWRQTSSSGQRSDLDSCGGVLTGNVGTVIASIVQLSDVHLHRDRRRRLLGNEPDARLREVMAAVARTSPEPDLVVLSGDLADDGSREAYLRLRVAIAEAFDGAAVMALAGNHDDPDALRAVMPTADLAVLGHWTVVGVGSAVAGVDDGRIGPARLDALSRVLDTQSTEHALVVQHHPVVPPCGCDGLQLFDAHDELELLSRHPSVRAVLSGHVHEAFDRQHDSLRLLGCPSTLGGYFHDPSRGRHDFRGVGPIGARLVMLHEDGSIETSVVAP
jgi:3',5'-cyclic-AMP phosphodiesterase